MIKKLLHKLRIWLIKMLNAVPAEDFEAIDAANNILAAKIVDGNKSAMQLMRRYDYAVREICRRSDTGFYDWCCEYCCMTHNCRRDGWCNRFWPRKVPDEK